MPSSSVVESTTEEEVSPSQARLVMMKSKNGECLLAYSPGKL